MHILVKEIVSNPGFITFVAAFFRRCVATAVEKELKREPKVRKDIRRYWTVPHQPQPEPSWKKSPKRDALVASVAIAKIKNTKVA